MAIEIKAPAFPESVADGEVATWHKAEGDSVSRDELIVEIETDKVVLEVVSPQDGVIKAIHAQQGDIVQSQQLLATIEGRSSRGGAAVRVRVRGKLCGSHQRRLRGGGGRHQCSSWAGSKAAC